MSINFSKDLGPESKNSAIANSESELRHKSISATSTRRVRVLYTIKFLSSVSSRINFACLYPIFNESTGTDIDKFGNYLNSIKSSCVIIRTFSSIGFGLMSDKFGRKPTSNIALLGSGLCMGLFGFNKYATTFSLLYALNSSFNCSSDIIKTMAVELSHRRSMPTTLAYLDYVEFLGESVGAILGAYFTIAFFGKLRLKGNENPTPMLITLIPCLISASINVTAYILSKYHLNETLYESRDSLNIESINSETRKNLDNSSKFEQSTLFGLSLSKNSKLILISSSLLGLSYNGFLFIAYNWPTAEISNAGFKLIVKNSYFTPLLFISMIAALFKYPYICQKFGALKVYKSLFPLTPALFTVSSILAHFGKTRYERIIIMPLTFLVSVQKELCYLYNTTSNLLLVESSEVTKNLGALYGISSSLGHITYLDTTPIFRTIQAIHTHNIFPSRFNYSSLNWGLLTTLSLTGYWISTKINNF
jgi:MFS family permease